MTLRDLPAAAGLRPSIDPLARRFLDAGHRLHLVGGVVRDLLLGRDPADLDFTTDARPHEIKAALGDWPQDLWTQGERFGTIGARRDGVAVEITTYRAESYDPSSRKPEVRFGDTLVGDLERRDFTINSMAVDLPSWELVDPHGGAADLEARVLRTPLSPVVAFDDDPLRMLRAARFTTRFDLSVAPEVIRAMTDRADRIGIVSAERIHDEMFRLLGAVDPLPGLRLLDETGLLGHILPEGVIDSRVAAGRTPLIRLAALLAPAGPEAAARRLAALKASNDDRRAVKAAVGALDVLSSFADLADDEVASAVRRLLARVGSAAPVALGVGDVLAEAGTARFRRVEAELRSTENLDDLGPGLDGHDIAEMLDVAPGPQIGEALRFLTALRLDVGELPADELRARLRAQFTR